MAGIRNVPEWARVPQAEYRRIRSDLKRTCDAAAFDFIQVWDLMLDRMEERHALVAKGRRKTELTLAKAAADMQMDVIKERASIEQEKEATDAADDTEAYVRDLARQDANRVKMAGLVS